MNKIEYVSKLRKKLSLDETSLSTNADDSITLILKNRLSETSFIFACSRRTDFSEKSFKRDLEMLRCLKEDSSRYDMLCRNNEIEAILDVLEGDEK